MRRYVQNKIQFDDGALGVLIIILLSQLFFVNGVYLFIGMIVFWTLFSNLQQPYKPSVFTIMLVYHTLQIMSGVWLSNYVGKELNFRSENTANATIFSYVGMLFLFGPIIYFQNKIPPINLQILKKHADKISIERTFQVYVIAFFSINALGGVAFAIPGLSQVIFSFLNIKWFFFLLFGLQALLKKKMIKLLVIFGTIEFAMGLFSYFSSFKTVMFFAAFIAIMFIVKVTTKQIIVAAIAIYALFFVGVMWTSIKGEYRLFLNQGTKTQAVNVNREDAMSKLLDLATDQKEDGFNSSAVDFFERLQYTYHLAKTMDRVPSIIPYQDGANIAGILDYVTTFRILNPNKPSYAATVKTIQYTGISYAGASSGTSFSLGYFADCYIDFGYYGMMFPLLILGFIFGSTYFYFVRRSSPNYIFNFAVVGAMFMEFNAYEADGTYLMGRLFATLVTFLVLKFLFFPWLYKYLTEAPPRVAKESVVV